MLHIATIHVNSPHWIPVQARELLKNIGVPYRTWCALEGIDTAWERHFDRIVDQPGRHERKLNRLAAEIVAEADDDDWLMFLDGDAFPVTDPVPLIEAGLSSAPLMAVRRDENAGDPQPHPCFCVTRVATWRELDGDWSEGPSWPGPSGETVTDVGAELLRKLERAGIPWTKVRRSNRRNLHPVFYGIYGEAIYHHGAGFREPLSRADLAPLGGREAVSTAAIGEIVRKNRRQSRAVFERIERDDVHWLAEFR